VPEFNQYIDKNYSVEDGEGNESYISHVWNEDLWKFLQIPEEKIIQPEPIIEQIPEKEEEEKE